MILYAEFHGGSQNNRRMEVEETRPSWRFPVPKKLPIRMWSIEGPVDIEPIPIDIYVLRERQYWPKSQVEILHYYLSV